MSRVRLAALLLRKIPETWFLNVRGDDPSGAAIRALLQPLFG